MSRTIEEVTGEIMRDIQELSDLGFEIDGLEAKWTDVSTAGERKKVLDGVVLHRAELQNPLKKGKGTIL